jgi:hypothetical protein
LNNVFTAVLRHFDVYPRFGSEASNPRYLKLFSYGCALFDCFYTRAAADVSGPALASFRWQFVTGSKRCGKEVKREKPKSKQ